MKKKHEKPLEKVLDNFTEKSLPEKILGKFLLTLPEIVLETFFNTFLSFVWGPFLRTPFDIILEEVTRRHIMCQV